MKYVILFLMMVSSISAEITLSITKTPFESFLLGFDFTQQAGASAITLVSATATNKLTGVITTPKVIAPSPVPAVVGSTPVVALKIIGGQNGETHIISVKVQNSVTGERYQNDVLVKIDSN